MGLVIIGDAPPGSLHPVGHRLFLYLCAKPASFLVQERTETGATGKRPAFEIQLGYALYLLYVCTLENMINQLCFGKTHGKWTRLTAFTIALPFPYKIHSLWRGTS